MPNTSPQGRVRDRERAEKREAKRPRGDLFEGTAPHFAAPSEPPRGEQFDAGSPEPPLTIEQRRLAVRRARAHADEVLDLLGSQGVPMPLTKQRLKEVCDWGEGLLNRGVDGRPRDAVSREIQAGLDAQRDAAMDVQDARNRTDAYGRKLHPYYPFESADQERVSMALEAMQLSAQQTDALFNLLHGGDGHASLLRPDLAANPSHFSRRALEEAADKMPRSVPVLVLPHAIMFRARTLTPVDTPGCSVPWEEHTMTLQAPDGSEQTVTFLVRDALKVAQGWLLGHKYDLEADMQFEPEMADTASDQVFRDYCNSLPNAVACAHLPRGQFTFLYEASSDASQYGGSRQQFHPIYISYGCLRTARRLKMDTKSVVVLLPHVDGADEKCRLFHEAIRLAFANMNHAGFHGVQIYLRGAPPFSSTLAGHACVCKTHSARPCCRGQRHLRASHGIPDAVRVSDGPARAIRGARLQGGVCHTLPVPWVPHAKGRAVEHGRNPAGDARSAHDGAPRSSHGGDG